MKFNLHLLLALIFIGFYACNAPAPRADDDAQASENMQQRKDCPSDGEVLPENRFLLRDLQRLVVLATTDKNPSGVLEVYNSESCELVNSVVLPENDAPDFPYYLAQIMYNNQSKIIGIRGFDRICLYDAAENKLSESFSPQYLTERMAAGDAETGRVLRLEVWENYLIGFAEGNGAFVFSLEDPLQPKVILPVAEYQQKNESYSSLFLLPSERNNETYQAIFPQFDEATGTFGIASLFEKPQPLLPKKYSDSQDGNIVILRENSEGGVSYAVDMNGQRLIEK